MSHVDVYVETPPPKPHDCGAWGWCEYEAGSIRRCDCGRYWLSKYVGLGFTEWRPVRPWYFLSRRRIRAWEEATRWQ